MNSADPSPGEQPSPKPPVSYPTPQRAPSQTTHGAQPGRSASERGQKAKADAPPADDSPRGESKTTFWDHISELRKRLLLAFAGVVLGAGLAYAYWAKLWALMAYPLTRQGLKVDFIATSPLESFLTSLKLSMLAGTLLAFPWIMWQAWRFLAPALFKQEKQLFIGAFFGSVLMFLVGAGFSYAVVLPAGLHFLATYSLDSVTQNWKQADYAAFISQFMLAFGLIFELPVATFVLAKLGLVTAKGLWGFFRYAILLIFIVAALLTPGPDPVSQILLALPLLVLYILSIGVAAWWQPKETEA